MGRRAIDATGMKSGKLTIMRRVGSSPGGQALWEASCECGGRTVVLGSDVSRGRASQSCGCAPFQHGHSRSSTYESWHAMTQRCGNRKSKDYPRWGGRGIKVCDRWRDFRNFLADMGERPDRHSIDRIDGTKGYEPGNCRWASHEVQQNNKCNVLMLTVDGRTMSASQWARERGLKADTVHHRLKRGWTPEKAIST